MPALLYDETLGAFKEAAPPMIWDDSWEYDSGTNEAALLNNIAHPEKETTGKIYYIQSYFNDTITQNVPYKVIDVNHEGTAKTVDLMSMVRVHSTTEWYGHALDWNYGRYSVSKLYSWVQNTCVLGYSANIQAKMCNVTERWREATGYKTGELRTRETKCKILNPYELFGSSISNYTVSGFIDAGIQDFISSNYGEHYSKVFSNSTSADNNRRIYSDLNMSSLTGCWTNSYANSGSSNDPHIFYIESTGAPYIHFIGNGGFPYNSVIRLSSIPS